MEEMRVALKDRLTRNIVAALFVYFIVIQALVSGFSSGAMAAAFDDAGFVICAPSGEAPPSPSNTHQKNLCPCGSLCQISAGLIAVPTTTPASLLSPPPAYRDLRFNAPRDNGRLPSVRDLAFDARGPPAPFH